VSGKQHTYDCTITWTGNRGTGTSSYRDYSRDYTIAAPGKAAELLGSSDPAFRGDAKRYNPEDLLVASLSGCHMLSYLHLAAMAGVVVIAYRDDAVGVMSEDKEKGGFFVRVTLRPQVTIAAGSDAAKARELHEPAHAKCFIANSVNFPVLCEPTIITAPAG
jgi:organic hydroperoxide reductase OsmC/OhrA